MSEKADAHVLFNLTTANEGQLPVKMDIELDVNFLGLKVPKLGFIILEKHNIVLDRKHYTKLLGIIGWNSIWLMYQAFMKKYAGEFFTSFECPGGVNPLLFSLFVPLC